MAACYWPSSHCIPAQKFVSMSGKSNHDRSPLDSDKGVCAVTTLFHRLHLHELDRLSQPSRPEACTQEREVSSNVRVGSSRINRLLFADDLVLLAFSQQSLQHALDRFSAACDRAGVKISTKNTESCLSTNPRQSMLQVTGKTLQQVSLICQWQPWVAEPFSKWGAQVHDKKSYTKFLWFEWATVTSQALKYDNGWRNLFQRGGTGTR